MKLFGKFRRPRSAVHKAGPWTCGSFDVARKISRRLGGLAVATLALGLSLAWAPVYAANVKAEISRIGDTTHLEFRGLSQWPYEIRKLAPNKFQIQVPPLDDATVAQLSTWSDSLVSQVDVNKGGVDGKFLITFTFTDSKVESFDYLTDDPSRLIIDLYRQPAAEKNLEAKETPGAVSPTQELPAKVKKGKKGKKTVARRGAEGPVDEEGYRKRDKKGSRTPAGDERLSVDNPVSAAPSPSSIAKGVAFDAADPTFSRLQIKDYEISEEAMIASRKNFYIVFPTMKMPVSLWSKLLENLPEFIINPRDDQENKEARLLLDLYERQLRKTDRTKDRIGAFLKVYDHFIDTYPDSEYDEIVKNLAAHIYFLRYQAGKDPIDYEKSHGIYKYLLANYPQSPLAERIQQWLAFSELERKDGLSTIQSMQEYLRRYPNSDIKDQVQLALAEGYLILGKYPDALKVYDELAKKGQQPRYRDEAVYRRGDVALANKDWPAAEKAYREALAKLPYGASEFPNAYYNLGESLFWQRKFKESLASYVEFLSRFPDHEYGGYAMTRAGELLEAMGADRTRVIGVFLESYFRYHNNPGADVARVRLLSQQVKGMKEKELKRALLEMKEIVDRSPLPMMDEFVKLMTADGYQRRGENEVALQELIGFFQSHPTSPNLDLFKARILRNISEVLAAKNDQGAFLDVLQTHARFAKTWLNHSDRMDVPYFVARAYEQAGVYKEAERIYGQVLNQRMKIAGTEQERVRKVNELLPTVESLRLRMAAVALQERHYPEAYTQLTSLKDASRLNPKEGSERVLLLAKIFAERGQLDQAKAHIREFLAKWQGEPEQMTGNLLELAEYEVKSGDAVEAEKHSDQVLQMRQTSGKISEADLARAYELKGRALQTQGKDVAAVEAYQQLLEDYEGQRPLGSIRYRVGDILFKRGDLAGAEKIWAKLDPEKYEVLRKLASERIENARWQTDHRKYIKRIPAMSGFKEE